MPENSEQKFSKSFSRLLQTSLCFHGILLKWPSDEIDSSQCSGNSRSFWCSAHSWGPVLIQLCCPNVWRCAQVPQHHAQSLFDYRLTKVPCNKCCMLRKANVKYKTMLLLKLNVNVFKLSLSSLCSTRWHWFWSPCVKFPIYSSVSLPASFTCNLWFALSTCFVW
jgi:hypothetical protein